MIECQKCKTKNESGTQKCTQCGANLLPGYSGKERLGALIACLVVGGLCFGSNFFLFQNYTYLFRIIITLFAVVIAGLGIWWAVRKTPVYERYEIRAKAHVKTDAKQAIADYAEAIKLAPERAAFDLLNERAKLCNSHNMPEEAKSNWQQALENINHRIAAVKDTDLELHKNRAEVYKHLGMEDEYAMEMLTYTLDKERSLGTKKGEIMVPKGGGDVVEMGVKKGLDDNKRTDLQKLRAKVIGKGKYAIVGYCAQCGAIVTLTSELGCSNNPKHRKISQIRATKKMDAMTDVDPLPDRVAEDNRVSGPDELTEAQSLEIKDLVLQGKKTEAIKLARQYMSMGMLEVKAFVEKIETEGNY